MQTDTKIQDKNKRAMWDGMLYVQARTNGGETRLPSIAGGGKRWIWIPVRVLTKRADSPSPTMNL